MPYFLEKVHEQKSDIEFKEFCMYFLEQGKREIIVED